MVGGARHFWHTLVPPVLSSGHRTINFQSFGVLSLSQRNAAPRSPLRTRSGRKRGAADAD